MITKIVKVPEKEAYYFCKRLFFSKFGDAAMVFADTLDRMGWVAYPYYLYEDSIENILLLFANTAESFNNLYATNINYTSMKIIVTDVDINSTDSTLFDIDTNNVEIIDISSLEDYYKTELSLKEFVNNLLKDESTTSQ